MTVPVSLNSQDASILDVLIRAVRIYPRRLDLYCEPLLKRVPPPPKEYEKSALRIDFAKCKEHLQRYTEEGLIIADDGVVLGVRPHVYEQHVKHNGEQAAYQNLEDRLVAYRLFHNPWIAHAYELRTLVAQAKAPEDVDAATFERQRNIFVNATSLALKARGRNDGGAFSSYHKNKIRWQELLITRDSANYMVSGSRSISLCIERGRIKVFQATFRMNRLEDDVNLAIDIDVPGVWDKFLSLS